MLIQENDQLMSRSDPEASVYADLHTHTRCSDGELAPDALVSAAVEGGLQGLSVTDHDTLRGIPAARAAADAKDLEFVVGIELSVTLEGDELHLLAYGVDPAHERLQTHIQEMQESRRRRAFQMMEQLRAHGLEVEDSDLRAQTDGTSALGRPHVAAALVAAGQVSTPQAAFEQYLGPEGPGYVPKPEVKAARALTLVHDAGGVGVLAHPGDWVSSTQIRQLVKQGLDGLEVVHPSHRASLQKYYRRLAEGHDLLMTGGSDFHRRTDAEQLGTMGMKKEEWERFQAAVA